MSRNILCGLLLFFVLGGCRQEKLDPSLIINIENDFYIDIFEDISNGEKVFHLIIESVKNQDCLNSMIDYSLQFDEAESQIILSINDIIDPETCIPGSAPAFVSIPFDFLEERGYKIQINLKDVVFNHGSLTVNASDYFLFMNTKNGFELLHNLLNRIPENTIWGYVGYETEGDKQEAENFTKDLENIALQTSFAATHPDGFYGYFSISTEETLTLYQEIEQTFNSNFIFRYDPASEQEIKDLLNDYCNENPGLHIYIFNDEGETFECL